MVDVSDIDLAASDARPLDLRMTSQAKVRIPLGQQLCVNGAMHAMAHRAAFAQGRVLENERAGLLPVTLSARFVGTRQRQPPGRLEDVQAVRIVALNAVHFLLEDRVMLRQMELGFDRPMTLKTGCGILAGINDELATPPAAGDVQAPGTVAGFAPGLAGRPGVLQPDSGMGARRKNAGNIGVAFGTGMIADKFCACDLRGDSKV